MKRSRESGVERERGERGVGGEGEFEGEGEQRNSKVGC